MTWLRLLVAVIAGTFGVLQFKDGLGISAGPSLSISAERRPGIYARMRRVASPDGALAATVAGTVALAVAVSLLETPCTAGLPLLWTTLLAEQGVAPPQALGLFAVYMLVFLLDELIVFVLAVVTLRATKVQERHGRALKLVAGSVLICLAVTMLVAPTALSTLLGTVVVFGTALAIAAVTYAVTAARGGSDRVGQSTS
jgi:cytochrome c biogenesis protein CcdA